MEKLFEKWSGEPCNSKIQMTANGSNRVYFRLIGETRSCIAAVNEDVRENEAFFFFAREMKSRGIRVPEVYAVSDDRRIYLQEDLGNVTLYGYLSSRKASGVDITKPMAELYRKAIDDLIVIQNRCKDIDFSNAYPRPRFDKQAIQWDLNYFKYYFLRLFHIPFDEQMLEQDYQTFIEYLLDGDCDGFMYRDFQSRNIMIVDDELYFIDFQGARQGAAQYDLASLLYSSKSDVPDDMRKELLEYYLDKRFGKGDEREERIAFKSKFYGYVLVRMMQAMGAYGYRGVIENKDYFVKSIPYAVNNLANILKNIDLPIEIPHLRSVWDSIITLPEFSAEKEKLTVSVFSFSYRKGVPFDKSGNGGGYVFDCRSLPNPGLYEEYKNLTGRDKEVIAFFEQHPETEKYLTSVFELVGDSVASYINKGYTRLMVNFGCTGGRHRSVYCAERLARHIREKYDCNVVLHHLEQSKL